MKSILFIIPYFGKWPVWFDAHLVSIAKNESINWLFVTDCKIPKKAPKNAVFIQSSFKDFNKRINDVIGLNIPLSVRKICDIRPAFGEIFREELIGYDFWGFCDVDIIWGDVRNFLKPDLMESYDIISSLNKMISGHFTLFKNDTRINKLYEYKNIFKEKFLESKYTRFEEYGFAELLVELMDQKNVNVFWDTDESNETLISVSHQEYYLDKWQWQNGKMVEVSTKKEIMYLHFINWKRTMKSCEITFRDNPSHFYISYNGIHFKLHPIISKRMNSLKNIFNGYYVKLKKHTIKAKLRSLNKRFRNKLKGHNF